MNEYITPVVKRSNEWKEMVRTVADYLAAPNSPTKVIDSISQFYELAKERNFLRPEILTVFDAMLTSILDLRAKKVSSACLGVPLPSGLLDELKKRISIFEESLKSISEDISTLEFGRKRAPLQSFLNENYKPFQMALQVLYCNDLAKY